MYKNVVTQVAAAALLIGVSSHIPAQDELTISSDSFVVGQTTEVKISGEADSWLALMVDRQAGDYTLPGGAWLGLGLSPDFAFLAFDSIAGDGSANFTTAVPDSDGLVGLQFYLQAAAISPSATLPKTSNRLDLTIQEPSDGNVASSVSQHGITWTFDKEYEVGQFANGDWWVVGPVNLISIDPKSTKIGDRTTNGSMINPSPENGRLQAYDSHMYQFGNLYGNDWQAYDPALNAALDVSLSSPRLVEPHSSIVSTMSVAEVAPQQLQTAAILTVLDSPPPAGSFRPPYCGVDKTVKFNVDMLERSLLQTLPRVSTTPSMDSVVALFEKPWLDHVPTWHGRFHHPLDNMKNYGRDIAADVGIGALMLHTDFSEAEKEPLLISMVQLGIDLYGVVEDGGVETWPANGGHGSGRKFPILFAGAMLDDPGMSEIGFRDVAFGEDQQTFFVEETSPGVINFGFGNYNASSVGMPEWGYWHAIKPSDDNSDWNADAYRTCCTANCWNGYALASHIMGLEELWNHDAFFAYMERYVPTANEQGNVAWEISWVEFSGDMWDAYRSSYSWSYDW